MARVPRPVGRAAILERLAAHDGPEREAAAIVLELDAGRVGDAPLDLAIASLTRQTVALATLIEAEAFAVGRAAVRLAGDRSLVRGLPLDAAADGQSLPHVQGALPLCDWQAIAVTACADESLR